MIKEKLIASEDKPVATIQKDNQPDVTIGYVSASYNGKAGICIEGNSKVKIGTAILNNNGEEGIKIIDDSKKN